MSANAVAKAAGGVVNIAKKQTLQSTGIWETLRKALAIDPNRSNGVPLNPHYRLPAPGSNDPASFEDPVTLPAADVAGNAYWRRDARRGYPRPSVVGQADVAGLLAVGSAARPKVELVGAAGERALAAARREGAAAGLAGALARAGPAEAVADLFVDGLPPLPSGQSLASGEWSVHQYKLTERSYPDGYPCRSFQ